jgi:hypothetical protein
MVPDSSSRRAEDGMEHSAEPGVSARRPGALRTPASDLPCGRRSGFAKTPMRLQQVCKRLGPPLRFGARIELVPAREIVVLRRPQSRRVKPSVHVGRRFGLRRLSQRSAAARRMGRRRPRKLPPFLRDARLCYAMPGSSGQTPSLNWSVSWEIDRSVTQEVADCTVYQYRMRQHGTVTCVLYPNHGCLRRIIGEVIQLTGQADGVLHSPKNQRWNIDTE